MDRRAWKGLLRGDICWPEAPVREFRKQPVSYRLVRIDGKASANVTSSAGRVRIAGACVLRRVTAAECVGPGGVSARTTPMPNAGV